MHEGMVYLTICVNKASCQALSTRIQTPIVEGVLSSNGPLCHVEDSSVVGYALLRNRSIHAPIVSSHSVHFKLQFFVE